jgi:hypothetical protein
MKSYEQYLSEHKEYKELFDFLFVLRLWRLEQ